MNKVLVIGCPGAGKSTFSRKLAQKTGLQLHYLDMLWHRPDRTTVGREEFDENLQKILTTDQWIIDGNYLRTLKMRIYSKIFLLFLLQSEACSVKISESHLKQGLNPTSTSGIFTKLRYQQGLFNSLNSSAKTSAYRYSDINLHGVPGKTPQYGCGYCRLRGS